MRTPTVAVSHPSPRAVVKLVARSVAEFAEDAGGLQRESVLYNGFRPGVGQAVTRDLLVARKH